MQLTNMIRTISLIGGHIRDLRHSVSVVVGAVVLGIAAMLTPLLAAENLLQQFKALRADTTRDLNALPALLTISANWDRINDTDTPILATQIFMSRAMQKSTIWAHYGSRVRALLARDSELAAYGDKSAQIYSQVSSLCQAEADIDRQRIAVDQGLKAMLPRVDRTNPNDINAWNQLISRDNSLDSQGAALFGQETALLEKAHALDDDIQNRLQKRQNSSHTRGLANSGSTTNDVFGTTKSNPKLPPRNTPTIGNATGAGAQLKAAAKEARSGDQSDFRKNYDEGGAQSDGSLVVNGKGSRQDPDRAPAVAEKYKSNPEIKQFEAARVAAQTDRKKAEAELKSITGELAKPGANKGDLGVKRTRAIDKVTKATSEENAARINEEEKARQLHFAESKLN